MNKVIKFFAMLGVNLLVLLETFFISVITVSPVYILILSVYNLITKKLPNFIVTNFLGNFLLMTVPVTLIYFIYVTVKAHKQSKRVEPKEEKQ